MLLKMNQGVMIVKIKRTNRNPILAEEEMWNPIVA